MIYLVLNQLELLLIKPITGECTNKASSIIISHFLLFDTTSQTSQLKT